MMGNKNFIITGLLVILFTVGVIYQFSFVPEIKELKGDALTYHSIAKNLIEKGQYSLRDEKTQTVRRAPLYPIFLASVYLVFGYSFRVVQLLQLLMIVFGGYILTRSIKLLTSIKMIPIFGLLLYCLYFPFLYYTSLILTEVLFTLLMILFSFYIIKSLKNQNQNDFLISGIILGFSALCKPVTFLFPIFIIIMFYCLGILYNRKLKLKNLFLIILTCFITIVPWSIRNFILTDKVIPITSGAGIEFWMTTDKDMSLGSPWSRIPQKIRDKNLTELEMDRALIEEGIKNIHNNPKIYIRNMIYNFVRFWTNIRIGNPQSSTKSTIIFSFLNLSLLTLGIFGLYNNKTIITDSHISLLLVILYFTLIHFIFGAAGRFSIPIIPYVIIFSSYGIEKLLNKVNLKFTRENNI